MSKALVGGLLVPDRVQTEALSRLMESREWPVIKSWLEDSLKALGGNAFDAPAVFWAQGSGQAITHFIDSVQTAGEKLKELRNQDQKAVEKKPLLG